MGLLLLVLAIALAAGALPSGGFWWDFLAALGYCALTLIAFMGWDSESPVRTPRLRLHRNLAILAAVIASAHAVGYLIIDATVVEYLQPAAPNYMLLGIFAWLLLIATTYSSLPGPRKRTYPAFSSFRTWHRALYLLLLGTSAWHVLATDFSLASFWQVALLSALLVGAPLLAYLSRRAGTATPVTGAPAGDREADLHPTFCGLAMIAVSGSFAGIKLLACATC
jgi:hypothetical protein